MSESELKNTTCNDPASSIAPAGGNTRAHGTELLISNLLRIGVMCSVAVVVLGMVVSFIHHPHYLGRASNMHHLTTPGAEKPETIGHVLSGLSRLSGQSIVMIGLLMLIATPVARVAASIVAFAIEGDRRYVIITTIVLALLLLSFVLGTVE